MLNQRRMIADPFELIMRNMRTTVEDEIDMEESPETYVDVPEQIYTCRPS